MGKEKPNKNPDVSKVRGLDDTQTVTKGGCEITFRTTYQGAKIVTAVSGKFQQAGGVFGPDDVSDAQALFEELVADWQEDYVVDPPLAVPSE